MELISLIILATQNMSLDCLAESLKERVLSSTAILVIGSFFLLIYFSVWNFFLIRGEITLAREAGHEMKTEDLEELNNDPDLDIPVSYDTFDLANWKNNNQNDN